MTRRRAPLLLTPDEAFARAVAAEVERQLADLPRKEIASRSLAAFGAAVVTRDLAEAVALANRFAPEHLELMVQNPRELLAGDPERRGGLSGDVHAGGAGRLHWRDPTMSCRPGGRPASPRPWAFTISSSGPASSPFPGRRSNATGGRRRASPGSRGSTDTGDRSASGWTTRLNRSKSAFPVSCRGAREKKDRAFPASGSKILYSLLRRAAKGLRKKILTK